MITVYSNEQAIAIQGSAPTKLSIINPKDRIQWVNEYIVEPIRHISFSLDTQYPQNLVNAFNLLQRHDWQQASALLLTYENDQDQLVRDTALLGLSFVALQQLDSQLATNILNELSEPQKN